MPVYYDKGKERWRFTFNRKIRGKRYRASKLLPAGWNRPRAETFDRQETARLYALATGIEQRDPLIDEAVDFYRANRLRVHRAGHKAERHLAALLDYYSGQPLSALPDIALQYELEQRGALSPATIRNRLAYLKAACRYAWKHHAITEFDPTARMVIPSAGPSRETYIKVPQLNKLLNSFSDREAAAIAKLAFYTGLRWISELLPRTKGDIRRNGRQVWLYVGETKNGTPRMVPVHPEVKACLKLLPFKRHWRDYYAEFEKARKKAGLPKLRMHDLRHSLASEIVSNGGTLADVQAALHHQSVASARRYAHLYPERTRHIMLKVGRKVQKNAHRKGKNNARKAA